MKRQTTKRDSNEVSLKEAIHKLLDIYKLTPKINEAKLQSVWAKIMGNSIAKRTTELILREKKLFVRISSAPLREEMSFSKDKMMILINEEMGEEMVTEIVFM